MARNSFKSYLMHKSGSTWAKLCDIKEFPDLGKAPDTLETTTLSDPMKTYINDIMDVGGGLEFNLNYDPAVYTTLKALEGTEEEYAVWFGATEEAGVYTPDGSEGKFTFTGDLSVYVKGASVSAVVEMGVSIAPTTPIVFSQGQ